MPDFDNTPAAPVAFAAEPWADVRAVLTGVIDPTTIAEDGEIDDVAMEIGDRFLYAGPGAAAGLYAVEALASVRATDADAAVEFKAQRTVRATEGDIPDLREADGWSRVPRGGHGLRQHRTRNHHDLTMKRLFAAILLATALLGSLILFGAATTGCSTTQVAAGHDPFVVEAEKDLRTAWHVVDGFLSWEDTNRKTVDPGVTAIADDLRIAFPSYLQSAEDVLRAYKRSRTPANRSNLQTWLVTVQTAMEQALRYLPSVEATQAYRAAGVKPN
jgi:hypothetical protein